MTAVKLRSDGWPAVSAGAAAYGLGEAPAKVYSFGETEAVRQRRAEIQAAIAEVAAKRAKPQVTEVCGLSSLLKEKESTQSPDQAVRNRHPLTPGTPEALAKLAIETGRTHPKTGKPLPPLEPWTCPAPIPGMLAYAAILKGSDGAGLLSSYTGDRLTALNWMRQEQLVKVDDGQVIPLSDADRAERRTYPGALLTDEQVKRTRSRYLGEMGAGLVLAAFLNLRNRVRNCLRTVTRTEAAPGDGELELGVSPRRVKRTVTGLPLSAYEICTEVNRIISVRSDLDGYRYMSAETCRRIITGYDGTPRKDGTQKHYAGLIELGLLTELAPPKAVRQGRTWRTLARVFGTEVPAAAELLAAFIAGDADRTMREAKRSRRHELSPEELECAA